MKRFSLLGLLISLMLCVGLARADGLPEHGATVAPFKKAPTIDGKIEPGEWDGAIGTVGFQLFIDGFTEARMGKTYCGFTNDRLYIAIVSEVSPAGAFAAMKNRDSDVIWDDGVEIWLDPNRDTRGSGAGDLKYYQCIGNPIGTIQDVAFSGKGAPNTGWNAHWDWANTVDDAKKTWTAEVSIPFEDLGWEKGKTIGRSIGVLIARNYKAPWAQCTWFPHSGAFVSWFAYPRIRLTEDAPSVQIESLGDKLFTGQVNLHAKIFNPAGAARKVQVKVRATSSDMPEIKDEKTIDLPANGSADYAIDVTTFHEIAQHKLDMTVRDVAAAADAPAIFDYSTKWQKAPEQKWAVEATKPDPELSVKIAYYPSYKFVRVLFDARQLEKEFQNTTSAKISVAGQDGKEIASDTMTWDKPPKTQELQLPDLPDGDYKLTIAPQGYNKTFTRTFRREHFAWEGNTLGITDQVLPPFEPIKVDDHSNVSVVLRDYAMDGNGLWKSVKAAGNVSAGGPKELLAGPMALKVDGQPITGEGKFTATKPNLAVFESQSAQPSVTIKTRSSIEYDGCMKVEMELSPGTQKQELKSLVLDIPLKDELMPLWHCCTASLRQNPVGATPAGEGDVWDSRKFADGNWYGNFKPYIWFGAEERGLCFFADNDKGWELVVDQKDPEKSVPCLVLNRSNGVLTLKLNIIQKPITLTSARTITFGLMASPGKPMPKDWRKVAMTEPVTFSMGYLGDNICSAKTPHDGDFSIMDKMQAARRGEKVDPDAVWKEWSAKHVTPGMDPKLVDRFRGMINLELNWASQRAPWFSYYFDEYHSTCQTHPETHIFQSEWSGDWMRPMQDKVVTVGDAAAINVSGLVRSHQDFACWYGAQHIKRGIGLYFDNAFLKRAYDPLTTSAYKLPNGDIQNSVGVWAHREYQKRIWVMHQQLAPTDTKPLMMVHMTNTQLIPTMVWSESELDLEWFYGPDPQQAKYGHDLLRTESLGRQAGCTPLVIAQISDTKGPDEEKHIGRTRFGTMFVHDIRTWHSEMSAGCPEGKLVLDFGYSQPDCQVLNYWDDGYPIKASDPECKSILLKRGGEMLLVLCTWKAQPETVDLTFGVPVTSAADAETKQDLPVTSGKISVPMEGYGVRFVRLK